MNNVELVNVNKTLHKTIAEHLAFSSAHRDLKKKVI